MKRNFVAVAFLSALFAGLSGCIDADSLPTQPNSENVNIGTHVSDWRDEVIYQLIVDRFYNGDINNDYNVDTRTLGRYHGGDWQGIIDKLDYLQELGVTTLWISPVVKNVEEDAGFASYHGYWTQDFIKHNPHFGDLSTLRKLSDELHKRDMKLIIDIVTNHVGQVFFYDVNMNGQPNEWLSGRGDADKGSAYTEGELSRVTEYDPDFMAHGIDSYTSMGIAGKAPVIFFDMPEINRVAPGPDNFDFNNDGRLTPIEKLGFSNPDWYHQRGRTYDYDTGSEGCTDYTNLTCTCERYITNYDGSRGDYLDGEKRGYCQNDQTLLGDFPGGLKDVATELPAVRQAMTSVFSYWIDVTDCDGFRIDTLKHVEYSFWEEFAKGIREHAAKRGKKNFLMFGEAFDGNDILLAEYTKNADSVDSVFLFSQKYAIDSVFKCPPGNNAPSCNGAKNPTGGLYGWDYTYGKGGRHALFSNIPRNNGITDEKGNGLPPRDVLINFLDNHDVSRYLYSRTDAKGVDSLNNALSFLLLQRGIPCIYYGTEQGFYGGNDPANRENMNDVSASVFNSIEALAALYPNYKPWDTKNPIFSHIKSVLKLRKAIPALRRGDVGETVWYEPDASSATASIYAFSRSYDGKSALIIVNTNEQSAVNVNDFTAPWNSGSLVNVLGDNGITANVSGGKVSVSVPPMTTLVLIPESDKQSYGL